MVVFLSEEQLMSVVRQVRKSQKYAVSRAMNKLNASFCIKRLDKWDFKQNKHITF